MYFYDAFALQIQSEIPLPELRPGQNSIPDVVIRLGSGVRPVASSDAYVWVEGGVASCGWREVGEFVIRDGREIELTPAPGAEAGFVRLVLLGSVLAILLHRRGNLVLHASAVAIDGRAAIIAGNKGEGKSTLTAALCGRGHAFLADDVVAVAFEGGEPRVLAGFPQIKLWPEAAAASFGDDPERLPRLSATYEKRGRRVENFADRALPVGGVFVLSSGPDLSLNRLSARESVMELVEHSFLARFGTSPLIRSGTVARHLDQCASLARRASVYRLQRPRTLDLLGKSARILEERCSLAGRVDAKRQRESEAS